MLAPLSTVTRSLFLLIVLLVPTTLVYGAAQLAPSHNLNLLGGAEYAHDQLIIKLRDGRTPTQLEAFNHANGVSVSGKIIHGKAASTELDYLYLLDFPTAVDVWDHVRRYGDNPNVEYAEPNYIYTLDALPNDPEYSKLWGLQNTGQFGGIIGKDIDAPQGWNILTNSSAIVVGEIDTGVNYNHPDLSANMWRNPGETPGNGVDDDGNGFVDDYYGYDFSTCTRFNSVGTCTGHKSRDGDPMDDVGHGTHVAGTIGAVGNNNLGVAGVSWKARIIAIKALTSVGGLTSDLIDAVNYATMMGVKITNNSWGGGGFSQSLFNAIQAAGNSDALFIAAAGNGGSDNIGDNNDATAHYPSSYNLNNIIAVAATDIDDSLTTFSNYGATSVDLAAPGDLILSTWYQTASSFADVTFGSTIIQGIPLEFSPATSSSGITAIAQSAGQGLPGDFTGSFTGKIAVIQRGSITFSDKVTNAKNAGAIGAIIYNNVDGMFSGTLGSAGTWIPSASISKSDGDFLVTQLPRSITFRIIASNYVYLSGTSMSTPHVAGAAALLRSRLPESSYSQIKSTILANVDLVPSLTGKMVSGGRLNLFNILATTLTINVTIVAPVNNAIFIHSIVPVNVTINKPTSSISYSLDNGALVTVSSSSFNLSLVGAALHSLRVQAVDSSGNLGISNTVVFHVCTGDLDRSGEVNILDVAQAAFNFGSQSGDPNYNFLSDIDEDGDVDIIDIATVAFNFDTACV